MKRRGNQRAVAVLTKAIEERKERAAKARDKSVVDESPAAAMARVIQRYHAAFAAAGISA